MSYCLVALVKYVSLFLYGCQPAFSGRRLLFRIKEFLRRKKSVVIPLCISKTVLPHLTHRTPLGCPSLPFITDSVNRHAYLLEPEISRGGESEWRVVSSLKKKATVWYLEAIWPQHSSLPRHSKQSQPRSQHNSRHSADTQCRTMEEGPYKYIRVRRPEKTTITTVGYSPKAGCERVAVRISWRQKVTLNPFVFFCVLAGWEWQGLPGHPDWDSQEPGTVRRCHYSTEECATFTTCLVPMQASVCLKSKTPQAPCHRDNGCSLTMAPFSRWLCLIQMPVSSMITRCSLALRMDGHIK